MSNNSIKSSLICNKNALIWKISKIQAWKLKKWLISFCSFKNVFNIWVYFLKIKKSQTFKLKILSIILLIQLDIFVYLIMLVICLEKSQFQEKSQFFNLEIISLHFWIYVNYLVQKIKKSSLKMYDFIKYRR